MTSQQANSISIREYLTGMNIHPKKAKPDQGMYYSPFRAETVPSFKVDFRKNLWYDFGSGEGGTMVDLVIKIHRCTFPEAMKILEGREAPALILPERKICKTDKTVLKKVCPLKNSALTGYLSERKINMDTALRQCVEVYYSVGEKRYYAVGFGNDAGGYELRNRYFKSSVSPKDITTFTAPTDDCMVFEGFMDYLSYLTIQNRLQPQVDTLVLNSAAHLDRAMEFLKRHGLVHACLDNDSTGRRVLSEIVAAHGHVADLSVFYENHKDLNEFLCDVSTDKTAFAIQSIITKSNVPKIPKVLTTAIDLRQR